MWIQKIQIFGNTLWNFSQNNNAKNPKNLIFKNNRKTKNTIKIKSGLLFLDKKTA